MRRLAVPLFAMIWLASHGVFAPAARAHAGPPFPLLVDQQVPGYLVSLWGDPDIGESFFYVVFEPDKSASQRPEVSEVTIWVQPVSQRLPRADWPAERKSGRGPLQFRARPILDAGEMWTVGMEIRLGDGTMRAFQTEVEATPPGLGPWDLLLYFFPFVLFGGLWVMVFLRRSRRSRGKPQRIPRSLTRPQTGQPNDSRASAWHGVAS